MKITDVKCYIVLHPGWASSFHWRKGLRMPTPAKELYSAHVRVDTDAGIVGHAGDGYTI